MNTSLTRMLAAMAVIVATAFAASHAQADPLPSRDILKFSQRPMDGTTLIGPNGTAARFYGHDELSTAYGFSNAASAPTAYRGTFMADDFADKFNSPVVHVKWWGSYLANGINPQLPVDKFLISFETDVPQSTVQPFSHPGQPILNQVVRRGALAPGSGTFTENQISPGGPPLNENLYEYNAELYLGKEFFQKPDTVYWLKIVAMVDLPAGLTIDPINPPAFVPRWGWHNRDYTINNPLASTPPAVAPGERIDGFLGPVPGGIPIWHFQDDAVTGIVTIDSATPNGAVMPLVFQTDYKPTRYLPGADGPTAIGNFSKDLAFELYTTNIPEPAACTLLAAGLASVVGLRRRTAGC